MRFYHHSRDSRYRLPQGAQAAGGSVTLSGAVIDCGSDFSAVLRFFTPAEQFDLPMTREGNRLSATVTLPDYPCLCHYDFMLLEGGCTYFYGGYSGEGRLLGQPGERFQITVYNGAFSTPDWFSEGVAYQIFPDRFCCGAPALRDERLKKHTELGRKALLHDSWDEEPLFLPHGGSDKYAPDDYFGGDLEGIRQKLPYLRELGVSCIYLNPIFEAASNHRYNTGDYKRIDPILGTEDDFIRLAAEAKDFGIRLILDGVFSHTGDDSLYFNRYGRYESQGAFQSPDSPYFSWYRFSEYPEKYECWWSFLTLPDVEELDPSYRDFICGQDGVLAYWQQRGASGWRLDVADELPDDFIRSLRSKIKERDSDALILGEVWEDCSNKSGGSGRRGYCDGDLLDGSMNYPFRTATLRYVNGETDAYAFNEAMQTIQSHYPKPFLRACLNLLSSHDELRPLSYLSGGARYADLPREAQACFNPTEQQIAEGKRKLCQAMAIMFSSVGVPCIYYGDEAGMQGLKEDRKSVV